VKSLFGDEIPDVASPRRHKVDKAHAAQVGSGPEGKTCKDCKHRCRVEYHDKAYQKCGLVKHRWTNGPGTDIRCKDAACSRFEEEV